MLPSHAALLCHAPAHGHLQYFETSAAAALGTRELCDFSSVFHAISIVLMLGVIDQRVPGCQGYTGPGNHLGRVKCEDCNHLISGTCQPRVSSGVFLPIIDYLRYQDTGLVFNLK